MSEQQRDIPGEEGAGGGETDWPSIKPDLTGGSEGEEQDPEDPRDPPKSD